LSQDSSKELMDELRAECGDSKFGYRLQAVFAHVLLRLDGEILEINARGHPDVRARLGDRELVVQVKTAAHRWAESMFEMSPADFRGISERGRREGFVAFLDCAEPVEWILVPANHAARLVGQQAHVSTLRAECDEGLSEDCTLEFRALLSESAGRILKMPYPILCRRALEREKL
jgi:hypothetical protein